MDLHQTCTILHKSASISDVRTTIHTRRLSELVIEHVQKQSALLGSSVFVCGHTSHLATLSAVYLSLIYTNLNSFALLALLQTVADWRSSVECHFILSVLTELLTNAFCFFVYDSMYAITSLVALCNVYSVLSRNHFYVKNHAISFSLWCTFVTLYAANY